MFVNNIEPILFSIGPFSVRYYGLIYALGFVLSYFWLRYLIKKEKLKLNEEQLDIYMIWLITGVVIGARLFEVFVYNVTYYSAHFDEIFMIWNGGMSFHGGLIGLLVVTAIFAQKYRLHIYDILDALAIPAAFSLMLGRIANYTNSELYGTVTTPIQTSWCVVFKKIDDYCRHPTQLYEALKNFFILIVLSALTYHYEKTDYKHYKKGTMFWIFILLYGALRFFISFYRDETKYFGLDVGQYMCVIMVIVSLIFLLFINRRKN